MPAKWQTWMPRHIDRLHGSTYVQFSDPAARNGVDWLLDKQWQSDDCTVPDDPQELSELSGLGAQLWEIHGARILKKFVLVEPGKRRNQVCYLLWLEAKHVYESRQKAALETNRKRTEKAAAKLLRRGDPTVTVTPSRHTNSKRLKEQKQKPNPQPPLTARGLGFPNSPGLVETARPIAAQTPATSAQPKENEWRKAGNGSKAPRGKPAEGIGHKNSAGGVEPAQEAIADGSANGSDLQNADAVDAEMKQEVFAYWRGMNPTSPVCPWGPAEDRALKRLRATNVDLSIDRFKWLLHARSASEVLPSALPHKWLRSLMEFASGARDRFGHLLEEARRL